VGLSADADQRVRATPDYISLTHVAEDDIVVEPFVVEKGGYYRVPQKPGLGVTLDQKTLEKYRVA
jgi:L-alanine-DL-glutamate epimerase-like enolase superfamily enzyme